MICGFANGDNCYVGNLTKIVKSDFDQKFDLAYLEAFNGDLIIGLKNELLYENTTISTNTAD